MIQIIGIRRIIILLVLIVFNAGIAAAFYMYVQPEQEDIDIELRRVQSTVSSVQGDLQKMEIEFEQLAEQQGRYDALKDDGFFSNQVRSEAKTLLTNIQQKSRVVSATASVRPGVVLDDEEAQKSMHRILASPIEIKIEAFNDTNVYNYLEMVEDNFPGHVQVNKIVMKRKREVTPVILRAIGDGANVALVAAEIQLTWRTFIPEDQIIEEDK